MALYKLYIVKDIKDRDLHDVKIFHYKNSIKTKTKIFEPALRTVLELEQCRRTSTVY